MEKSTPRMIDKYASNFFVYEKKKKGEKKESLFFKQKFGADVALILRLR